jgi:hypothetical protein
MGFTKGFDYRTERWFTNSYGKIIKNIITQHPVAGGKGVFHISHFYYIVNIGIKPHISKLFMLNLG